MIQERKNILDKNHMPPLTVDQAGETLAGGGDLMRSLPTPFLTKTFQLVDDQTVDDLISWNGDGSSFVVWHSAEFARDLLPKYFKHNNFSSFVRQLNTYGFKKVAPERWEFAHDYFRRGQKYLLCDIQRRKISVVATAAAAISVATPVTVCQPVAANCSPTISGDDHVTSSISPPSTAPACSKKINIAELLEENERLKTDNAFLSHQLTDLKYLCGNIVEMIMKYDIDQVDLCKYGLRMNNSVEFYPISPSIVEPATSVGGAGADDDDDDDTLNPRLFGVNIGVKRTRETQTQDKEGKVLLNQTSDWNAWGIKSEPSNFQVDQSSDRAADCLLELLHD